MRSVMVEDFEVVVGESAAENDQLIRTSDGKDIWMHLENASSAHVIVKTGGRDVPKRVLNMAAVLLKNKKVGGRYRVTYTEISNVKLTSVLGTVVSRKTRTIRC